MFAKRPFPDHSALNGYSGNKLNRLGELRQTLNMTTLLNDPRARFHLLSDTRQVVKSIEPYDGLFTLEAVIALGGKPEEAYLLGLYDDGTPEFATTVPNRDEFPDGIAAIELRGLARSGALDEANMGATAQARSLVLWHQSHPFCAQCGKKTKVADAGYSRRCPSCKARHFPRTDPVVIMLIVDGDNCLLGRSPHFPEKLISCLAGFVEVGETIEEAVRRETLEESGILTNRVLYHSSQPWPFPSSLMIGCFGEATSFDIKTDDELDMCAWFDREETQAIVNRTHPDGLWGPPPVAIAHQLMKNFAFGDEKPTGTDFLTDPN